MKKVSVIMGISFIVNFLLATIKIVVGFVFKSSALFADGLHSFSDLITDVIAIIGNFVSRKPADLKHPFGHGKLEYLTSFIIGIIILGLGFSIISGSFNKEIVVPSVLVIIVSIFTIVLKFILSSFLINRGKKLKNNILIASGKESSTDVLSSIVVLISAILMRLSEDIPIFRYADICATIIVGIFIVRVGFLIIKENVSILIGECETNPEVLEYLNTVILNYDEVIKIDNINLLKYGPYYKLICEVSINGNLSFYDAHSIVHKLEDKIKQNNEKIKYVTIHANPYI